MNELDQTKEARQASMSRVSTPETIIAKLESDTAASKSTDETVSTEQDGEQQKVKKTAQDRIREAIARRNDAENEAEQAKIEAKQLRVRLEALEARAPISEAEERPNRSKFTNDEEFIEALADFRAHQVMEKREREKQEAQARLESEEIGRAWEKRQEQVIKDIPDYLEVIGDADIDIAPFIRDAILESEIGPHLAYYLALNQDEIKKLNVMKPIAAVKYLTHLEDELREEPQAKKPAIDSLKQRQTRAPEPINTVKDSSSSPGKSSSFEEYRKRRNTQKGK